MNASSNLLILSLILNAISLLGLFVVGYILWKQSQLFRQVTQGVSKKDLKTILQNLAQSFKELGHRFQLLDHQIQVIQKDNQTHFQKMGFIRYNPFSDTGGDQSFCLCLLDDANNGIVITSLHSREQTRIYAKHILSGQPEGYELSKEEQQALEIALKKGKIRQA